MDAAQAVGVRRLLFLGSSCIYPRLAPQPITDRQATSDGRGSFRAASMAAAISSGSCASQAIVCQPEAANRAIWSV